MKGKSFPVRRGYGCCKLGWPCWGSGFRQKGCKTFHGTKWLAQRYRDMYGGLALVSMVPACKSKCSDKRRAMPRCWNGLGEGGPVGMLWKTWADRRAQAAGWAPVGVAAVTCCLFRWHAETQHGLSQTSIRTKKSIREWKPKAAKSWHKKVIANIDAFCTKSFLKRNVQLLRTFSCGARVMKLEFCICNFYLFLCPHPHE